TQLIGGIQENMFIQKQELQGTPLVPPANGTQSDFQLNQFSITITQLKAIAVRERNQRLADELNSPSAKGLAIVAQSQVAVMIDMNSVKGGGEGDAKLLGELVMRVRYAMAQNGENL
ncbi:hypothetical protein BU25DRAFT_308697, partial [Macroventuria anomochaeta]